jgi:hypothetical protein
MEHFLFACRWLVQALKCCQVQKIVAYRGLYISHGAILFVESTWCVMACTCSMEHFVFAGKLPQWWLLRRGPPPGMYVEFRMLSPAPLWIYVGFRHIGHSGVLHLGRVLLALAYKNPAPP